MDTNKRMTVTFSNGTVLKDIVEIKKSINDRETTWDVSMWEGPPTHRTFQQVSSEYYMRDIHGTIFSVVLYTGNPVSITFTEETDVDA